MKKRGGRTLLKILPVPTHIKETEETFLINYDAQIIISPTCDNTIYHKGVLLQQFIEKATGTTLQIGRGHPRKGDIFITQLAEEHSNDEYYELEITPHGITLSGSEKSIIHAVQTLHMIIAQKGSLLNCLTLHDAPVIKNRGFYYDITRGRMPTFDTLKALVDLASRYKLNQLQLYVEHTYFFRDFSEVWRSDTPITSDEIMALDAYCEERGIELIPSIATCSHMYNILRTKQYKHLCELADSDTLDFTARDRMRHHTIDISNDESLTLVKKMMEEFRWLFKSNKFNLCADETFDMGKGRSAAHCQTVGEGQAYVDFVKALCEHARDLGAIPMMWGDVILNHQELLNEFPKETIFLNWQYEATVNEEQTNIFSKAGVTFYNCPGVSSWSRFIDDYHLAFENIKKMATYAKKYEASGLLNTCWGDFYHTSQTQFSSIGLIYGAQFAWSDPSIDEIEINAMISHLEFGACEENIVDLLKEISEHTIYPFLAFCIFSEDIAQLDMIGQKQLQQIFGSVAFGHDLQMKNDRLAQIKRALAAQNHGKTKSQQQLMNHYLVALDGVMIFNQLGTILAKLTFLNETVSKDLRFDLAQQLEKWFYYYKINWRSVAKEGELWRLDKLVAWYGDYLREGGLTNKLEKKIRGELNV